MFVIHWGFVDEGIHSFGALYSTRELAFAAAKSEVASSLDNDQMEISFDVFEDKIVAAGLDYAGDLAAATVFITELVVDSGEIFYGEIV